MPCLTHCALVTFGVLWIALSSQRTVDAAEDEKALRLKWQVGRAEVFQEYDLPSPVGTAKRERASREKPKDERGKGSAFYGNLLVIPGKPLSFAPARHGFLTKVEASTNGVLLTQSNLKPSQKTLAPTKYLVAELRFSSFSESRDLGVTEYLLRYQLIDDEERDLGAPVAYYQRGRTRRLLVFEGNFAGSAGKSYELQDPEGNRLEFTIGSP